MSLERFLTTFFFFGSQYHMTHVSLTVRITSTCDSIMSAFQHPGLFVGPMHIFSPRRRRLGPITRITAMCRIFSICSTEFQDAIL